MRVNADPADAGVSAVETSEAAPQNASRQARLLALLHRAKRPIAAVAAVGAVCGGLVGYFNAYKTVRELAEPPATSASPTATSAPGNAAASAIPVPTFAPPAHSIAVMPFANMSGDPKQDYFSDGLSEELLNSLASIRDLQVAARTSSFSFKGKDVAIADIARKLNVGAVLEGSVRRDGTQVRVTAQLIDAVSGFHLWSKTYDRDLKNVLALETEIATAVTQALQATLLADAAAGIEVGGTKNPLALDAYLRGSGITPIDRATDLARIAAFDEAIRLDPGYAKAYAAKSRGLTGFAGTYEPAATAHALQLKAHAAAQKAVELAPDLADAHFSLAWSYELGLLDFSQALNEYERALALAPGDKRALSAAGVFFAGIGRFEAGVAHARHAVELDPLNGRSYGALGTALFSARRYTEAIDAFNRALSLDPNLFGIPGWRGIAYYELGDLEAALSSCKRQPRSWVSDTCLAVVEDKLGRKTEAQAQFERMQAENGDAMAYQYAEISAQRGEPTKALAWLDTAYRFRDPGLSLLKMDVLLDPLRQEPRFKALERTLKFPN